MGVKKNRAPEPEAVEASPEPVGPYSPYSDDVWQGCIVANDGSRKRSVRHEGVIYEHCADTPDGRWIYKPF